MDSPPHDLPALSSSIQTSPALQFSLTNDLPQTDFSPTLSSQSDCRTSISLPLSEIQGYPESLLLDCGPVVAHFNPVGTVSPGFFPLNKGPFSFRSDFLFFFFRWCPFCVIPPHPLPACLAGPPPNPLNFFFQLPKKKTPSLFGSQPFSSWSTPLLMYPSLLRFCFSPPSPPLSPFQQVYGIVLFFSLK